MGLWLIRTSPDEGAGGGAQGAPGRPQHPHPAELLWRASPIALNCAQVVSILIKHVGHGQLMISCPFLLCVAEIGGCSNP